MLYFMDTECIFGGSLASPGENTFSKDAPKQNLTIIFDFQCPKHVFVTNHLQHFRISKFCLIKTINRILRKHGNNMEITKHLQRQCERHSCYIHLAYINEQHLYLGLFI